MESVYNNVYEASKSIEIADNYIREFNEVIKSKKEFPYSGIPLSYDGMFTGFYSVNYKKYKAFYRIKDNYMEVIRIIMMKQDYMAIIFPEDSMD